MPAEQDNRIDLSLDVKGLNCPSSDTQNKKSTAGNTNRPNIRGIHNRSGFSTGL